MKEAQGFGATAISEALGLGRTSLIIACRSCNRSTRPHAVTPLPCESACGRSSAFAAGQVKRHISPEGA